MSHCSRLAVASLLLSLSHPVTAAAQMSGETAGFIIQLGNDTIAVEQYRRSSHHLESELAVRVPFARRVHFLAALDSAGRVRRFDMTVRPLTNSAGRPATSTVIFNKNSADLTLTLGDSVRRLRIPTRPGAVPLSAFSASLIELAVVQARRMKRDSVEFDWLALGSPETTPSYVAKHGKDSVAIGFLGSRLLARVDGKGRIQGLDGRETTQKVRITRVKEVNVGAFATTIAQEETARGPAGQLSPRDTVWATVASAHLVVDYGRPRKRGREIFGGVVPWNKVWRAGANAATQLTTDQDLRMGDQVIPKGVYSLWMLPEPAGAKLIVNRQSGQWGTEYDSTKDLCRLDLARYTLPSPVEAFTIAVAPRDRGGVLTFSWDNTAFFLPFTVIP